jgi:phosphatidylglycerophosphate synthase
VLDGWWVRSRNQVTTFGAVLDPITDKLFVGTVVTTLLVVGRLQWPAVVCLATREIGEAPLVAWLLISPRQRTHRTRHAGANVLGKLVTVLQFVCVVLAIALPAWNDRVLLGVTAALGALAAVSYWRRALAA